MSRLHPSRHRLRLLAGVVLALTLVAAACQTGAVMWTHCDPHAPGGEFGTDRAYVLHCRDNTWQPLMTVDEFVRAAGGERLTPAPVPTEPTTTTTPAGLVDVDYLPTTDSGAFYAVGDCDRARFEDESTEPAGRIAQSFTAGRTGSLTTLSAVLWRSADASPLLVSIRQMVGDQPGPTVIGGGTFSGAGFADGVTPVEIELSAPAQVEAGSRYAVEFSTAVCDVHDFWYLSAEFPGRLDGGSTLLLYPGESTWFVAGEDIFLRTRVR